MLNLEEEEEEDDVDEWRKSISTVENHGKFNIGWLTTHYSFLVGYVLQIYFSQIIVKREKPFIFFKGGGWK